MDYQWILAVGRNYLRIYHLSKVKYEVIVTYTIFGQIFNYFNISINSNEITEERSA